MKCFKCGTELGEANKCSKCGAWQYIPLWAWALFFVLFVAIEIFIRNISWIRGIVEGLAITIFAYFGTKYYTKKQRKKFG